VASTLSLQTITVCTLNQPGYFVSVNIKCEQKFADEPTLGRKWKTSSLAQDGCICVNTNIYFFCRNTFIRYQISYLICKLVTITCIKGLHISTMTIRHCCCPKTERCTRGLWLSESHRVAWCKLGALMHIQTHEKLNTKRTQLIRRINWCLFHRCLKAA